jgi:hypothetical protein
LDIYPIHVISLVTEPLEKFEIIYLIGGSLASSIHGVIRATMDVDILADLKKEDFSSILPMLEEGFFLDEVMIQTSIAQKSSFNLIHKETSFKVDIFISKGTPFEQSQFQRRQYLPLSDTREKKAYFASAEDIILAKLDWYRLGGEVSTRQWQDVVGILKVQRDKLDREYLEKWALTLEISDLLKRVYSKHDNLHW